MRKNDYYEKQNKQCALTPSSLESNERPQKQNQNHNKNENKNLSRS